MTIQEENKAREALRKDVNDRIATTATPAALYDESYGENIDDKKVMNATKFFEVAEKALRPTGCKIRDTAAEHLSEAVQLMTKNILESAVQFSKRKRW